MDAEEVEKIDGYGVLRNANRIFNDFEQMKLVFLSERDEKTARPKEADAFFQKPVTEGRVANKIYQLMGPETNRNMGSV